MPRSKLIRKTKEKISETHSSAANTTTIRSIWLNTFERELDNRLLAMDTMYQGYLDQIDQIALDEFMLISKDMGNKTIGELVSAT